MNNIALVGRLTEQPQLKQANNGDHWMRCGIAVKRERKDKNGEYPVDFFTLTAFGSTAEFISKYFGKGQRIAVTGCLQSSSYETTNGDKATFTTVVVRQVEFCDAPQAAAEAPKATAAKAQPAQTKRKPASEDYFDFADVEIPF